MKSPILIVILLLFAGCKVNQFTGKKTLNLYGNEQLFPMAFREYDAFLAEHKVVKGTADSERIQRIGAQIAAAAQNYFEHKGMPNYLNDYAWDYNLVEDKTVNAWCMPGGKIVFYNGILPIAANDDGIAAIMGHEVAHALADHGAQRMSASTLQIAGAAITDRLTQKESDEKRAVFMQAYGVASTVGGMLPFSRKHESEADKIGLQLMAIAGYDVYEAPKLWERMKAASKGGTPEFLSTHPSEETRIENLKKWIPEARQVAQAVNDSK